MQVTYHPKAAAEVVKETRFYEERAGLGNAFHEAVDNAVQRIRENPLRFASGSHDTRRCPLARFPHRIVYRVENNLIRVYAVAHPKREPGYWAKRLE